VVGPAAKRVAVGLLRRELGLSVRRACRTVGLSTATWRYQPSPDPDAARLERQLREQAAARPRFGYRRLHTLLERTGWQVNHKRLYRVYRAAGLQVRRRARKRRSAGDRVVLPPLTARRQRWSMDFMRDTLADGRPFRTLNIVDDYTRECVAIEVDRSLPGARVVRVLARLAETVGLPATIVVDNGPEFVSRTVDAWTYARGVTLSYIRPGKPVENAYIESFNGKFRDECLSEHWFATVAEAQAVIEDWRLDYNQVRPHSALGNVPPTTFAEDQKRAGLTLSV